MLGYALSQYANWRQYDENQEEIHQQFMLELGAKQSFQYLKSIFGMLMQTLALYLKTELFGWGQELYLIR